MLPQIFKVRFLLNFHLSLLVPLSFLDLVFGHGSSVNGLLKLETVLVNLPFLGQSLLYDFIQHLSPSLKVVDLVLGDGYIISHLGMLILKIHSHFILLFQKARISVPLILFLKLGLFSLDLL